MSLPKINAASPAFLKAILLVLATSAMPHSASAHHSFQAFDMKNTVTMEGVLTDFSLTNPHAYFTLDVTNSEGDVEAWEFESVNASTLQRLGINQETFVIGEQLSIEAHPPRNAERRLAAGELIRKADGTEHILSLRRAPRNEPTSAPELASSIEGVWLGPALTHGLFFIAPNAVKESWPLTQKGQTAVSEYDGSQSPSANCTPYAPPAVMLVPAPISIVFGDEFIEIGIPNEVASRKIFIDGRSHPDNVTPSNQGYSIGRWEDETLIVETALFEEHRIGNAFGLPSSLEKHLIERLSLNQDRNKLDYSFVLEDPIFLTQPVKHSAQWTYSPNSNSKILDCDPEAAKRFLDAY